MNTLRENTNTINHSSPIKTSSPEFEISMNSTMANNSTTSQIQDSPSNVGVKPKTPLRKDELEKIAKQLKKKLSKASITAKQSLSPNNTKVSPKSASSNLPKASPLKYYMLKKNKFDSSPSYNSNILSSSPNLYSPNGKSPTQMKNSNAVFLSSSPLKGTPLSAPRSNQILSHHNNYDDEIDSPTKKGGIKNLKSSPLNHQTPKINLEQASSPTTTPNTLDTALKPSPSLSNSSSLKKNKNEQTTPTLPKRQLHTNPLRTPTQSKNFNTDEEGADLLMYLATSPSPAKPYHSSNNTPRSNEKLPPISSVHNQLSSNKQQNQSTNSFPPPLTPKRHITNTTKTPQNRLTPSINLFNNSVNNQLNPNGGSGLPSSGLTLTPAGFNMSDYVFFTPSPGSANIHHNNNSNNNSLSILNNKNFLKTPDFNTMMSNYGVLQSGGGPQVIGSNLSNSATANIQDKNDSNKLPVDGKMINFDKDGLFGNNLNDSGKD